MAEESVTVGILTVSDRCFNGITTDESGDKIEKSIKDGLLGSNYQISLRSCVPDDISLIMEELIKFSDKCRVHLILTTGGTGFDPRDVTPEATKRVIEKEATGMSIRLTNEALKITSFAMLSRLLCGIRKQSLIINLPGSPKACMEYLLIMKPVLPHALSVIKGQKKAKEFHKQMISAESEVVNDEAQDAVRKSKVDVSRVARRGRNMETRWAGYPLLTVPEAYAIIEPYTIPKNTIYVHIEHASGYVLSEDIQANESLPPFPASVKDGYAVLSSDGAGKRSVISSSLAGSNPLHLQIKAGECVRITTGACVPNGADAVVQVEDTKLLSEADDGKTEMEIEILKAPKVGLDIRKIGSDIEEGTIVVKRGTVLSAAELAILASIGVCNVTVYSRPLIGVISTGDEICSPEELLPLGKIRDSNKIALLTLLKENSFSAIDYGIVHDDTNALLEKLDSALGNVDILITSGGVSMGEKDILSDVLIQDFGAQLHIARLKIKPGKPLKFFTLNIKGRQKLVFGLPGNPVSAMVTFQVIVLPALKHICGRFPHPVLIKAKTDSNINLDDRYEYARATLQWVDGDTVPRATLTGHQASSRLLSMISANCLLHLPITTESQKMLPAGTLVDAEVIKDLHQST